MLLPEQDTIIEENLELIRIIASLIRNGKKPLKKTPVKTSPQDQPRRG